MRTKFPIYGRGKELPRVRTAFGINEKSMTGMNAPSFNVKQQTLPDGTRVKLTTIGTFGSKATVPAGSPMQPSLRLATITQAVQEGVASRCTFESGFFDLINPITYGADGYFSRIAFRAASGVFVNSEEFLGSLSAGAAGRDTCPFLPLPGSMATSQASRFSGKMRQVVQLIAGQKEPIPFGFCWGETHGIYVANNGSWWVIEISIITGIRAWPLPYCEVLTEERKAELNLDMPGIPSPTPGTPIYQLATAAALADYAATYPFYLENGWAFSYTGHEAQVVTWGWNQEAWPHWKQAKRWRISFSESNNHPSNAVIQLAEETFLDGDLEGSMKFPHYIPNQGGQSLLTFDMRPEPFNAGPPPGGIEAKLPIYVYYTEASPIPVIWYIEGTDVPADEAVNDWPPPNLAYCAGSPLPWAYESSPGAATGTYGTYTKVFSGRRKYTTTGPVSAPADPSADQPAFSASASFTELYSEFIDSWFHTAGPGPSRIFAEYWESTMLVGTGDYTYTQFQAFMIPFYDREQAYVFYKELEKTVYPNASGRVYGLFRGEMWTGLSTTGTPDPCFPLPTGGAWRKVKSCGDSTEPNSFYSAFASRTGISKVNPPRSCAPWWLAPPYCAVADVTLFWDNQGSYPTAGCPSVSQVFGDIERIHFQRQALYAFNAGSGVMEQVQDWDEYDPYDPYFNVHLGTSTGSQILVSHPDAFTNNAFLSAKMDGYQGDEYHFFGSPQSRYALTSLTSGVDRGWFGKPFF